MRMDCPFASVIFLLAKGPALISRSTPTRCNPVPCQGAQTCRILADGSSNSRFAYTTSLFFVSGEVCPCAERAPPAGQYEPRTQQEESDQGQQKEVHPICHTCGGAPVAVHWECAIIFADRENSRLRMTFLKSKSEVSPPKITVSLEAGSGETKLFTFSQSFRIGRLPDCEVCIPENCVSRTHAEVVFEEGEWRLRDLKSANGTYVKGELIQSLSITDNATVRLGNVGPILTFSLEEPRTRSATSTETDTTIAALINRYFE